MIIAPQAIEPIVSSIFWEILFIFFILVILVILSHKWAELSSIAASELQVLSLLKL